MSVFRRRSRGPPIEDPPATIRRGTSERSGLAPAMLHETSPQSSELRLRISAAREARLGHDQSPAPSSNGSISAAPANFANLGRVSVAEGPAQDRAPPDATETEPIGRIGLHSTGTPSGSGQTLVVRRHPVGSLVTADRVGTVRKARRSVFGRGGGGGGGESATEMHSRLLAVIADRDLLLGFIKEAWKPQGSPLHGLGGSPSVRLDRVAGGGSPPKGGSTTSTAPQPAPGGNLSATVTILSARLDRLRDGTSRGPSDPETFDRRQSKRKGKSAFNLQKEVQALHAEFTMWMEAYEHEQRREASRLERSTELERLVAEFMQSLKENEDELARVTERANQLELSVAVLRRELKNKETEARESHDTLKFTQKKLQDLQTSHEFVLTERTAEAMAMHDLQTEVESLRKEREVVRQQAADDAKTLILKHLESGGDSGNAKELSQADDNPLHRDLRQAVARLHNVSFSLSPLAHDSAIHTLAARLCRTSGGGEHRCRCGCAVKRCNDALLRRGLPNLSRVHLHCAAARLRWSFQTQCATNSSICSARSLRNWRLPGEMKQSNWSECQRITLNEQSSGSAPMQKTCWCPAKRRLGRLSKTRVALRGQQKGRQWKLVCWVNSVTKGTSLSGRLKRQRLGWR